jgi:hypothetical protein
MHAPREFLSIHHNMVRRGTYDPSDLARILMRPDLHPENFTFIEQWRTTLPPYGPCVTTHPHLTHCLSVPPDRFVSVARWILPVYGAVHFVPLLLFKRAAFARTPIRMILRTLWGTVRSTAFLSAAFAVYQGWFCMMQNAHRAVGGQRSGVVPEWFRASLVSRPAHWLGGLIVGLSVFIEAKHRHGELAMYVLPKALESVWVTLRGRGLVLHTGKYGNPLVRLASFDLS